MASTGEPQFLMDAPFDVSPGDPQKSRVQQILVYAFDTDRNEIPTKTLEIRNNASFTVYPVMRDGNEAETTPGSGVGLYDPYDNVRTEYRGYIGYQAGDQYCFGLRSGQAITVRVPLVFWNGARMGIVTDGKYIAPPDGTPNPLYYDAKSQRVIVCAEHSDPNDSSPPDPARDGVIMWYRAALIGPAPDSPDQLLEWTIRDRDYLSNPQITNRTDGQIPSDQKVTLINYDVSYVDNMLLPIAMEALDVPVPAPPTPFNQNRGPYGWTGSIDTPESLEAHVKAFTALNNGLLGQYFGGSGWPAYNVPSDPYGHVKIPSGQSVFAQSPLAGTPSSYDNNTSMLSSGGTSSLRINIGGQGTASTGSVLTLSSNANADMVNQLRPGFAVVGYPAAGQRNPIQDGAKIAEILHVQTHAGDATTIRLDKDLVASQEGCNFDFFRPVSDYASDAMAKLWYSWANHYLIQTQSTQTRTVLGSVDVDQARLTLKEPVEGLVEGMQVTGPGLDDPNPNQETSGVTILAVATDKRSVTLSQLARTRQQDATYTFAKPQALPATPADLFELHFSDPDEPARVPLEFAKKVYLVMASMAQIPKDANVKAPHVLAIMDNVVGGNMGFMFDTSARRFSADGLSISATIRDMIKSVLRGVTDFTQFSEFNGSTQTWYPDPSMPRGGLAFNAFNLDPFVWFVHVKLGFSGYGFSLDDDTADVGAGEATKFQLTVGGDAGLANKHEWAIQTVYGPVSGSGHWDPTDHVSFYQTVTGATNNTPVVITTVDPHHLSPGDKVDIDQVGGNMAANGTWTVANPTAKTFELLNSAGNGDYTGGGRWTTGPLPFIGNVDGLNVFWKLKGDDLQAGFTGALVSGPGVQSKGSVRIQQLGDDKEGVLALNTMLTNADGSPLAKGEYEWMFSAK